MTAAQWAKREASLESYHALAAAGLCTHCKREVPVGRTICDERVAEILAWKKAHPKLAKAHLRKYKRKERERRIEEAVCTNVGCDNPAGRGLCCDPCADARNAMRRLPNPRRPRICSTCRGKLGEKGHDRRTCPLVGREKLRLSVDDYATARTYHEVG